MARVGSRIYIFGGEGMFDPHGGTSARTDCFDLSATQLMYLHRKR